MMTYNERKDQLDAEMRKALQDKKDGFSFVEDETPKVFYPHFFGEVRRETLLGIFFDEEDDSVIVITRVEGEMENGASRFREFSNSEMKQIMMMAGVPVPEE